MLLLWSVGLKRFINSTPNPLQPILAKLGTTLGTLSRDTPPPENKSGNFFKKLYEYIVYGRKNNQDLTSVFNMNIKFIL